MTIYVDLDGTLAHYDGWKGSTVIGDPIPLMVDRVKGWISQGKSVKIFTARICGKAEGEIDHEAIVAISDWTEKHIGVRLGVTNVKGFDAVEFWDDRAVGIGMNTGKIRNHEHTRNTHVLVEKDTYDSLVEDSQWLACLEAAGVDNWNGYDYARDIQKEWEEEDAANQTKNDLPE